MVLSHALGCLLFTANFLLNFYLHRSAEKRTILDDQVNVLSANSSSPSGLLLSFIQLFTLRPYLAIRSKDFLLTLFVGVSFYVLQIYSVVWPGIILRGDPIPYSPGICGFPVRAAENTSFSQSWMFSRYERQIPRYEYCTDSGNSIFCPGSIGQKFSWDIFESEPGQCWFGEEYCFEGSTTITQRATITPRDLGTLRESAMSLTVSLECSHLNNTPFIEHRNDVLFYMLGNPDPDNKNVTLVVSDDRKYHVSRGTTTDCIIFVLIVLEVT